MTKPNSVTFHIPTLIYILSRSPTHFYDQNILFKLHSSHVQHNITTIMSQYTCSICPHTPEQISHFQFTTHTLTFIPLSTCKLEFRLAPHPYSIAFMTSTKTYPCFTSTGQITPLHALLVLYAMLFFFLSTFSISVAKSSIRLQNFQLLLFHIINVAQKKEKSFLTTPTALLKMCVL